MKILQSDLSLASSHHKHDEIKESETLHKWNRPEEAPQRLQSTDRLELSHSLGETSLDPKLMSILRAVEAMTGKKIAIPSLQTTSSSETPRVGWGVDYNYNKTEIHEESLDFSAQGSVKTEGGKSIDFSLAFALNTRVEINESISFKAGDALIDPLVLNFGSDVVTMSDVKHSFDLDLDGRSEEFSFVGSGSGFLALDKNSDGIINNGSELFGPTLGNGFDELALYDSDANNWIDENDAVFEKLLIWTKDESGNENLFRLKDKGIGALYLGKVQTSFELNQAQIKESSIYLKESGEVGTLQEIDLVV